MKQETYIRIYGHLRSFNNKRNVVAFKVLPLTDVNELTSHLLETIHSHMYLDKARKSNRLPASHTLTESHQLDLTYHFLG